MEGGSCGSPMDNCHPTRFYYYACIVVKLLCQAVNLSCYLSLINSLSKKTFLVSFSLCLDGLDVLFCK